MGEYSNGKLSICVWGDKEERELKFSSLVENSLYNTKTKKINKW